MNQSTRRRILLILYVILVSILLWSLFFSKHPYQEGAVGSRHTSSTAKQTGNAKPVPQKVDNSREKAYLEKQKSVPITDPRHVGYPGFIFGLSLLGFLFLIGVPLLICYMNKQSDRTTVNKQSDDTTVNEPSDDTMA